VDRDLTVIRREVVPVADDAGREVVEVELDRPIGDRVAVELPLGGIDLGPVLHDVATPDQRLAVSGPELLPDRVGALVEVEPVHRATYGRSRDGPRRPFEGEVHPVVRRGAGLLQHIEVRAGGLGRALVLVDRDPAVLVGLLEVDPGTDDMRVRGVERARDGPVGDGHLWGLGGLWRTTVDLGRAPARDGCLLEPPLSARRVRPDDVYVVVRVLGRLRLISLLLGTR